MLIPCGTLSIKHKVCTTMLIEVIIRKVFISSALHFSYTDYRHLQSEYLSYILSSIKNYIEQQFNMEFLHSHNH